MSTICSVLDNPRNLLTPDPVRTYAEGRVCAHDGCGTRLSRYNPGDYCGVHEDDAYDPRTVAMAYTEDGNRVCTECGRAYPPDTNHWQPDASSRDGFAAICIKCMRPGRDEKSREAQKRANAKYREKKRREHQQQTVDHYYRKRYGQPSKEAYLAAKAAEGQAMLEAAMAEVTG